jgi:hypothetical protein
MQLYVGFLSFQLCETLFTKMKTNVYIFIFYRSQKHWQYILLTYS